MKDLEGVGEVLLSSCTMLEKSEVSFDTMPSPATMVLTYDDEFWDFPLTSDGLYDYLLTSDYEFWDFSMISYDEPSYSVDRRFLESPIIPRLIPFCSVAAKFVKSSNSPWKNSLPPPWPQKVESTLALFLSELQLTIITSLTTTLAKNDD